MTRAPAGRIASLLGEPCGPVLLCLAGAVEGAELRAGVTAGVARAAGLAAGRLVPFAGAGRLAAAVGGGHGAPRRSQAERDAITVEIGYALL
ncbi:DUF6332 family protein, partial [Streptomyces sp. NPDC051098]|uniref:DUF6332 family protein n=1 Tax=Streptomyces sp. NPDC051098 TaxID=3155411 RepID=UPI00343AF29F